MNWKVEALELYRAGKKVSEIANKVGRSRKTVSSYINKLPSLEDINKAREKKAMEARKEYKKKWKKNRCSAKDAALMKRQHEIDVLVLSREQYFSD